VGADTVDEYDADVGAGRGVPLAGDSGELGGRGIEHGLGIGAKAAAEA